MVWGAQPWSVFLKKKVKEYIDNRLREAKKSWVWIAMRKNRKELKFKKMMKKR